MTQTGWLRLLEIPQPWELRWEGPGQNPPSPPIANDRLELRMGQRYSLRRQRQNGGQTLGGNDGHGEPAAKPRSS